MARALGAIDLKDAGGRYQIAIGQREVVDNANRTGRALGLSRETVVDGSRCGSRKRQRRAVGEQLLHGNTIDLSGVQ